MTTFIRKNLLLLLLFSFISNLYSQKIEDNIVNKNIKSLQVYRDGWKLSYPIIELNGDVKLVFSFDEISPDVKNYSYHVVHCDADWNPTPLSTFEYIDGPLYEQINQYDFSFNTYTSYIHYELKLPNDDLSFKISGNYAIIVYDNFDEEDIVFTKRFMVVEKLVNIEASIKRPSLTEYRNTHQEVDFTIAYGSLNIEDPFNDISVFILQNGRWDNAIDDLKPLFTRQNVLDYDYQKENLFPGGNEFRWFDIKSLRYQSPYIKSVKFESNIHNVELFPDEIKANKGYFFDDDLNGKFYIEIQEEKNDDTDADYVWVNFSLPMKSPLFEEDIYISGALTNWNYTEENKMDYDPVKKQYTLQLLLKQGYYNYQYGIVKRGANKAEMGNIEGNHYETDNDYIFLVYHHAITSRYDRIIGYQIANSVGK